MTLSEVYASWKQEKSKSVKPTTFSLYVIEMEKHVLPYLGDKGPITEEDVLSLQEKLLANGRSNKTAHDCVVTLMGVLRYAGQQGWWPMPTWQLSHKAANRQPDFRLLTPEEQHIIINHIRTDRSPRNIGVYIAMTTGVSVGELCNLTWQDIDIKAKVLHVRGIISRFYKIDTESDSRVWSVAKDEEASCRDIPLSPAQLQFLGEEEGRHLKELYLFSNDTRSIDARVVRAHITSLCKILGLKGVQYKDLRHSFAVRCLQSGCGALTLSQILGVSNVYRVVKTYEKYIKTNPRKYITQAVDAMMEAEA